jgi:PadR family transcriptional regulator PadR
VVVWASGLFFPRERHGVMAADNHKIKVRPTNWLTPVALVILREESSYGYELMERLEEFGFAEINAGTLYRTLRQMENEGLCESEWETSEGGPARRMYAITDAGESYLAAWAEGCKRYQSVMDCFFQAYTSR